MFHVRCARLRGPHSRSAERTPTRSSRSALPPAATLAASDNNDYYADPVLAYRFEQAGDYLLEIRDVRYQGNQYWEYCIEISSRPLVETRLSAGRRARASRQRCSRSGIDLPEAAAFDWTRAGRAAAGHALVRAAARRASRRIPCRSSLPTCRWSREADAANDPPDAAQLVAVPGGINGRIEREGDVDCFAFEAKKGEALSLEVVARRRAVGARFAPAHPRRQGQATRR